MLKNDLRKTFLIIATFAQLNLPSAYSNIYVNLNFTLIRRLFAGVASPISCLTWQLCFSMLPELIRLNERNRSFQCQSDFHFRPHSVQR